MVLMHISMLKYIRRYDTGLLYKLPFMCLILSHMLTLLIFKYSHSCSQVVFVQQKFADKVMCYGVPAAGIHPIYFLMQAKHIR